MMHGKNKMKNGHMMKESEMGMNGGKKGYPKKVAKKSKKSKRR